MCLAAEFTQDHTHLPSLILTPHCAPLPSRPLQIYGVHVSTTMVPILGEILAKGNWPLFGIYVPYLVVPGLLATKMALMPDPFPYASGSAKKGKGGKRH
jgi:hypothetical protein